MRNTYRDFAEEFIEANDYYSIREVYYSLKESVKNGALLLADLCAYLKYQASRPKTKKAIRDAFAEFYEDAKETFYALYGDNANAVNYFTNKR